MQLPADLLCVLALVVAVAAVAAFLIGQGARRRLAGELATQREATARLEGQVAAERASSARVPELEAEAGRERRRADDLRTALADSDAQLRSTAALLAEKVRAAEAGQKLLAERDAERADLGAQVAALGEALRKERIHADEKQALLTDARERMTKEFRLLADELMVQHGERFGQQNKEQVEGLLGPMRDKLAEFQQGLQAAHVESAKERATLGEQIRGLNAASARMSVETTNLTRALKGQAQAQGAWGEMILESVLERSGLRRGEEYVTQASGTAEDGQRLRPDVVVTLPGDQRRIVIDAKVSLVAFDGHVNAASDDERGACLRRHLDSMRAHIRTLGSKDYLGVANSRLDFVVMFVPIEGALAAALTEAPELAHEAADHNVAIATPTTLMIALRTVASVWQVERRNRNAEDIAKRAGALYDKFAGFVGDMGALGDRLGQADQAYRSAMSKLSNGKGSLARQIEHLKTMGASARKSLPASLLGGESDDETLITEAVSILPPAIALHGPEMQG